MNDQALLDSDGTKLKRVGIQRRLTAFLISSCAAFSVLLVGWSWTINGYQTNTEITIRAIDQAFDKQQFHSLLANTIRTKVTDQMLGDLVAKTKAAVPLQSRILMEDLESLRKAIHVSIKDQNSPGTAPLKVLFSLNGIGSMDEQAFFRAFTADIADELNRISQTTTGRTKFVVQNAELARYRQVVDDLTASVSELERKFGEVEKVCGKSNPTSGPFRNASFSSSKDASHEQIENLRHKVSNIDLEFFHKSTGELKSLLDEFATSGQEYALPKVQPIGTPQPKQLFVLSILAAAFGLVVSNHYRPFASQGFSSIAEVSRTLGIPVVATFPITQGRGLGAVSESADGRKQPWANRLTRVATAWLWAFATMVIGFCCISQEIREIFFQNPVDGLARAFWFFKR